MVAATKRPPTRSSPRATRRGSCAGKLEANGALADGKLDLAEAQGPLFSVLETQGNPVSLDVLPGSNHLSLSEEGWRSS
jgi:hypothetical protein